MENSFQTSFIPKKPVDDVIKRKHHTDLFTVISILLLVITILASGSLYVYKVYLEKNKESLSSSLEKSRVSFEEETIKQLESFDKRASSAKEILANHKVVTPLFTLLEDITIPNVQYTKFTKESTKEGTTIKIEGVSKDYGSIAVQSDIFNSTKGRFFDNIVFSDLLKGTDGLVNFKLSFTVNPDLLSYEKSLLVNGLEGSESN